MGQGIWKRNNVQVLGSGRHTLIFAHGFGSEQSAWRHQVKAFQDRYRIVLFDHVGCGQSDFNAYSPHRYRGVHAYAEDVLELCEELNLADCTLVGHSFSGMVGVVAALADPSRFRQLIFVKTTPRVLNDPDTGYVGGFSRAELDAFFAAMSSNYYAWASGFAPLAMGNPERPALGLEFARTLSGMRPDIALAIARIVFQYDHRADLPRLKIPSLIVHAGEDLAVPNEVGEYMARLIPDSKLTTIDASGHLPHLSAPLAVNRALAEYLAAAA
ncbi:alpha/beta hydrolase [Archangium violaceum]|uniref:alpha/beta fold hydrolase n=1 Tax=Archangium violaceum TaxID=83451 RepID=UPI002B2E633E|nr:alpha/beta hydrolase [Archangium violaceum]